MECVVKLTKSVPKPRTKAWARLSLVGLLTNVSPHLAVWVLSPQEQPLVVVDVWLKFDCAGAGAGDALTVRFEFDSPLIVNNMRARVSAGGLPYLHVSTTKECRCTCIVLRAWVVPTILGRGVHLFHPTPPLVADPMFSGCLHPSRRASSGCRLR